MRNASIAALSLLLGVGVSGASQDASHVCDFLEHTEWGMPVATVEKAMASLTLASRMDEGGTYRYGDSLGALSYEIMPGFMSDSLHLMLVRFHTTDRHIRSINEYFEDVESAIREGYGRPLTTSDSSKTFRKTKRAARVAAWENEDTELILVLDRNDCQLPQLDLLCLSKRFSVWMSVVDSTLLEYRLRGLLLKMLRARSWFSPEYLLAPVRKSPADILTDTAAGAPEVAPKEDEHLADDFPSPDEYVETDEAPIELHKEFPSFPDAAEEAGVSGIVWIEALVDRDGKVRDAFVMESSGTCVGFEEAALEAAYLNTYIPAKYDGEPVAVWVCYKVDFRSTD